MTALSPLDATLVDELRVGFQGLYLQTLTKQPTEIAEVVHLQVLQMQHLQTSRL